LITSQSHFDHSIMTVRRKHGAFAAALLPLCLLGSCQAPHATPVKDISGLLNAGDPFAAEALLRDAHPRSEPDALLYAQLVLERDNWREAESIARGLHGDEARLILAQAQERRGDAAGAVGAFRKLGNPAWLCRAEVDAQDEHASNACAALQSGDIDEAVAKGQWLYASQQYPSAEEWLRGALRRHQNLREVRQISILRSLLGRVLAAESRAVEAEAELWAALAMQNKLLGGSLYLSDTLLAIGISLLERQHPASAQAYLLYALKLRQSALGARDWRVQEAQGAWAECLRAERRFGDAGDLLERSLVAVSKARGESAPEAKRLRRWLTEPVPEGPAPEF
jgi:tetratricopeptide (TPR) repeat protein